METEEFRTHEGPCCCSCLSDEEMGYYTVDNGCCCLVVDLTSPPLDSLESSLYRLLYDDRGDSMGKHEKIDWPTDDPDEEETAKEPSKWFTPVEIGE